MFAKWVYAATLSLSLLLASCAAPGPSPTTVGKDLSLTPSPTRGEERLATSTPLSTVSPPPTPVATPSPTLAAAGPLIIDGLQATQVLGSTPLGRIFYAVTAGGLYLTEDGGGDWTLITGRVEHDEFVFGPAGPAALYAGTGRSCIRQEPEQPLFKSNDSGFSWARLPAGMNLRPAAVDPRDSDRAYAIGCDGPYLTTDGGATWARLPGAAFESGRKDRPGYLLSTLAVSPADPERVYAGGAAEGGNGGVFVRAGEPVTWTQIAGGEAQPDLLAVTALAVSARDARRVFFTEAHGVWRSDDGGVTWQMSNEGLGDAVYRPGGSVEQVGLNALALDAEGRRLFLGARRGLYRSEDGGVTWNKVTDGPWGPDEAVSGVHLISGDPLRLYVTTLVGVYVYVP